MYASIWFICYAITFIVGLSGTSDVWWIAEQYDALVGERADEAPYACDFMCDGDADEMDKDDVNPITHTTAELEEKLKSKLDL